MFVGPAGEKRGWEAVVLLDVKFERDGVKTVQLRSGRTWTIIVSGRVAVVVWLRLGWRTGLATRRSAGMAGYYSYESRVGVITLGCR